MKQLFLSALILFCVDVAHAQSDIFVCTDAKGVRTFGNVGERKGCKKVDLPGLTTFPAPKMKRTGTGKASGNFPKVDDATQSSRDAERRQILDAELKAEQKKLSDLNDEYKNGEPDRLGNERNYAKYQERTQNLKKDISRAQQNIEAIQREIGGLN